MICPKTSFRKSVTSNVTNNVFLTHKPVSLCCTTKNVVYLISCTVCGMQYVGQTSQSLKSRMSAHRHSFDHDVLNTFLSKHFKEVGHSRESFTIDILDYGINTRDLLEREDLWIRALNTAFPLGLNDQISHFGNISNDVSPLCKSTHPYFSLPVEGVPQRHRSRNVKRRSKRSSQCTDNLDNLLFTISTLDPPGIFRFIKSKSKVVIKRLLSYTASAGFLSLPFQERYKVFSIVCGQFWKETKHKSKRITPTTYLKCNYLGNCMERLRLERELNRTDVRDRLSRLISSEVPHISVLYTLASPTSTFLCNYGHFLRNLSRASADHILNSNCPCSLFPSFVDPHYGHICTGDTALIRNHTLRSLFQKGSKFRTKIPYTRNEVEDELRRTIKETVMKIGRKGKSSTLQSQQVADELVTYILPRLMRRYVVDPFPSSYSITDELRNLHKHFIVTIVDKASGNYAFTCKKQYLRFMENEMNTTTSNTRTYEPVPDADIDKLLSNHNANARSYGLMPLEESALPRIYAIPKMHKTPIKARFITGAHNSSLKPISLDLQCILRYLRGHFRRYCTQITERTGINHFFSIDNTEQVVHKLRSRSTASSALFCADFTSLFTNLPHSVVLENLFSLIDLLFDHSGMDCISVTNGRAKYVKSGGSNRVYHRGDVKLILKFILNNSYATYAGTVYKQNTGIPQGNNASPQIADLTLAYMEYKYVKNHINRSNPIAHSLSCTFRYIDDLLHCSSQSDTFRIMTVSMYHPSLTLERTNNAENRAAFLDLDISCTSNGIQTALYNKTDDYTFRVIRYPHFTSNIPKRIGLNTFHGEIIRIFRTCTHLSDFTSRTKSLIQTFETNQYPRALLISRLVKTLTINPSLALKYTTDNQHICVTVISGS